MSAPTSSRPETTGWVGWILFAAVMILVNGAVNALTGLSALLSDDVYVEGPENVVVLDLTSFGWIHLFTGVLLLITGFLLIRGEPWAVAVAVMLVALNMVTQMLQMPFYPFWSLGILVIDLVVLWALVFHGRELRPAGTAT